MNNKIKIIDKVASISRTNKQNLESEISLKTEKCELEKERDESQVSRQRKR